jgi:protein phosphatase
VNKPQRAHLYVAANTHPGMRGKNNEDRYAVSTHRFGLQKEIPSVLAVVCDGIGGHRAGEVAAEIAVETISRTVAASSANQPLDTLAEAVYLASEAVRTQSDENPERKGMGATCVCTWIIGDRLYTASVGDSRLYLLRGDDIQQVTTDHTWIQEAIEFGALTPEQAHGHPNAHVIRRYLGSQSPPESDFRQRLKPNETDEQALANQGTRLQAGDILLLVSDGLTDLVEPHEIQSALRTLDREEALQTLIDLANERGGHDNITTVLLEAPANFGQPKAELNGSRLSASNAGLVKTIVSGSKKSARHKWGLACALIAVLIVVLSASGAGLYFYLNQPEKTPTITVTPTPESSLSTQSVLPQTATSAILPPSQTPLPTAAQLESSATLQGPQEATLTPWPTNTQPPPTLTQTLLPPTPTQTTTPANTIP